MLISTLFFILLGRPIFCQETPQLKLRRFETRNLQTRSFPQCKTSTDQKFLNGRSAQKDKPCIFPFYYKGKRYNACTYDDVSIFSQRSKKYDDLTVGNFPWCATEVDKDEEVVNGKIGICEDSNNCPIPPRYCGDPVSTRIVDFKKKVGYVDDITIIQMPWMVTIGKYGKEDIWDHKCGGSLITQNHILTAAHCFDYFDAEVSSEDDRYYMRFGTTSIGDPDITETIDREIDDYKVHPKYKHNEPYFDVGIAYTKTKVEYTPYIRPICLPMNPIDDDDYLSDDFVTLSGWGVQYNSTIRNYNPTSKLKLHTLQVNSRASCNELFSEEKLTQLNIPIFRKRQQLPRGITNEISCVGNEITVGEGACDGDSGSPVIRRVSKTARGNPYFEQHYIVSTGLDCKLKATIYVRVSNREILPWIQKETDTSPLIMVMGGFNSERNESLNDIEIISGTEDEKCAKSVQPINIVSLRSGNTDTDDYKLHGHTGIFAKDAPRICGGKNNKGEITDTCFEYNALKNKWAKMGRNNMEFKRFGAETVLNAKEDMWVMGGSSDSNLVYSETFKYRPPKRGRLNGKWRKAAALPAAYRDSGLENFCAVKLNSTHVFIAGGYAKEYVLRDPFSESQTGLRSGQNDKPIGRTGGGFTLSRAWMHDGYYWEELPSMSIAREGIACSAVNLPMAADKTVEFRIMVAGGCQDRCKDGSPPLEKTELYNPFTGKWEESANLPVPLHSARMENLNGVPTIFGGYDGSTQNAILYQYHFDSDQWIPHPNVTLSIGREKPAVFQVPKYLIKNCAKSKSQIYVPRRSQASN